jgi:hypothetical protein
MKDPNDQFNSASKPIGRRAFVFGGGTSMVRMVAQCNRDADPRPSAMSKS